MHRSSNLSRHLSLRSSPCSRVELLEDRRLMSVTYGANLILNPGAETYKGTANGTTVITPTSWTANGDPTIAPYAFINDGNTDLPTPPSSGKVLFTGGPDTQDTDLFQTIDLSSISTAVDAGQVKFAFAGYLGGYSSQGDAATLTVNYQSASKGFVSQAIVGPVTPTDRKDETGLLLKSKSGTVPKGTRFAQVQLHFDRTDGNYNDGYADNLSLILTGPSTPTTGSIAGTVYNDANGNGKADSGEAGLAGVKVFLDTNGNGKADTGESTATTTSAGAYSFTGLKAATYSVREIVPSTYRATTTNPLSVVVASGASVTGKSFGDSQTVLITGTVFADANGNKKKDTGEAGIKGVTVYLDFNNNGQLDSFETKTTTDSSGNYSFIVPFGTYTLRQVVPTGYKETLASSSPVTFPKGALSAAELFGDEKA